MGQWFSWFRGAPNTPALQDVAVEQESQSKQPTPTPAAPVSTVKPAEYEKGVASSSTAALAAKPGTTAAPAAKPTSSTVATSTAAPVSVATVGPTVTAGVSTGAKAGGGVSVGGGAPTGGSHKVMPQAPAVAPAKAPSVSTGAGAAAGTGGTVAWGGGAGAGKPSTDQLQAKDTSKDKAQSTVVSPPKSEPSKVTPAGVTKPAATAGSSAQDTKPKDAKVKVEVPTPAPKTSTQVSDPFDALAGSLPSSHPVAPKVPQFTGPEVEEPSITSGVAQRCGERESTLPPGYRREDMEKRTPAGVPDKPKQVSKPLTLDDAVDSLSAGFESAAPRAPKAEANVISAAQVRSNYAPPPPSAQQKQQVSVPASVSPAPPADKKVKDDKPKANEEKKTASVQADKPKEVPKKEDSAAPPADKKAKVEKVDKPKTDEDDSFSLDALSALSDTLPAAKPTPEPPKPRPEDIIHEEKLESEKGVRVGEREDTLPPGYRFSGEKDKKPPAPQKEPSLDPAEALDILSGDFTSCSAAPAVHAPVPPSAPAKQPKVENLSAADALAEQFVAPTKAKNVAADAPPAPPAAKSTPVFSKGDSISLDALSALEDTLPTAVPTPQPPNVRPEDIVEEATLSSEKGVRVGERDDTLPPDYRFPKGDPKQQPPPPQREPSMDPTDALDILSGDFDTPSVAPSVQAPVPPSAPPAKSSADFALEELAGDFVAPRAASQVHAAATVPPKPDRQLSEGTSSAMDALSDTLMDICPAPQPVPVSPKDIVKEKEVVEEKVSKAGERDDSLPPDYRPTEADIKAAAEAKAKAKAAVPKQPSLDDAAALDLLSSEFSAAPAAAPVPTAAASKHTPPAKSPPTQTTQGPVLDKLAASLLPDFPETKPKDSKPKAKSGKSKSKQKKPAHDAPATGDLSGPPSTDVVSTSSTKKGGKS